jgi:hypothetical protein
MAVSFTTFEECLAVGAVPIGCIKLATLTLVSGLHP